MVTPNRRRVVVDDLIDVFGVSQRRACRVVGQHRSVQRHQPKPPETEETRIREWLVAFSRRRPRWGWRRAHTGLVNAGFVVNKKRVHRLWRDEGLQVPTRRRKKRMVGVGVDVGAMSPICPNALWALDFQFDHTINGRQVKMLNVIDEFTRECLAIVVDHSIGADRVVATLTALAVERGRAPAFVRFDNGPEFVAHAVADWCQDNHVDAVFIDPGSPWQNAWIESFNGRLRDELLNGWQFDSLLEAQVIIEDWRVDYNLNRPHSSLNQSTPDQYRKNWTSTHQLKVA
jgi:putative transposase